MRMQMQSTTVVPAISEYCDEKAGVADSASRECPILSLITTWTGT